MRSHSFLVLIASLAATSATWAQEEPSGLMAHSTASSGSTDVAKQGFEAPTATPEETNSTELSIAAGGLMAAGNSKSIAFTSALRFRHRASAHQLSVAAAANYGSAAPDADSAMEKTVENYQGRARYDYFLSESFAAFLATSARRDQFQGLDLRLSVDPGGAYYFIVAEKHRLWTELGYDLQYDVRADATIDEQAQQGVVINKTETRHNARGFLGYDNDINTSVSLSTGLEYLQALSPFRDELRDRVNWRLNWDFSVSATLASGFSLATSIAVKYDNSPLPGIRKTDAVTALNLVYEML